MFKISRILLFLVVTFSSLSLFAMSEDVKSSVNKALDAGRSGDYARQFKLFEQLLSKGKTHLGVEGYQIVRAYTFKAAFDAASTGGEENCTIASKWTKKGMKFGPPEYTEPFDIFYPFLLTINGSCSYRDGNTKSARKVLTQAVEECKNVMDQEGGPELCGNIDRRLEEYF